jgi:hypothetical protein
MRRCVALQNHCVANLREGCLVGRAHARYGYPCVRPDLACRNRFLEQRSLETTNRWLGIIEHLRRYQYLSIRARLHRWYWRSR